MDRVSHLSYLGSDVSFKFDKDSEKKVNRFQAICRTVGRTLERIPRKETQMTLYKVMDVSTLKSDTL